MTWQDWKTLLSFKCDTIGRHTAVPIVRLNQLATLFTLQFTTCKLFIADVSRANSLVRDHFFDQVIASRLLSPTQSDAPCPILTTPDFLEDLNMRNWPEKNSLHSPQALQQLSD